jgi:ankyrin repeat protein
MCACFRGVCLLTPTVSEANSWLRRLDNGANINAISKTNRTSLLLAAEEDHNAIVEMLLNHDVTPLMCSSMSGHKDTLCTCFVKHSDTDEAYLALLDQTAMTNVKINAALLLAVQEGSKLVVEEVLLQIVSDVDVTDSDGLTPLMWAAKSGCIDNA